MSYHNFCREIKVIKNEMIICENTIFWYSCVNGTIKYHIEKSNKFVKLVV